MSGRCNARMERAARLGALVPRRHAAFMAAVADERPMTAAGAEAGATAVRVSDALLRSLGLGPARDRGRGVSRTLDLCQKRVDLLLLLLLDAWRRAALSGLELVIAGAGPDEERVHALAARLPGVRGRRARARAERHADGHSLAARWAELLAVV